MNICYIVAKEDEAAPFVDRFNVEKVEGAFNPLPCILYQKKLHGEHVLNIVVNGTQHGSSLVGCEAATLTTIKAIETLQKIWCRDREGVYRQWSDVPRPPRHGRR